jgi:hypothetical protein
MLGHPSPDTSPVGGGWDGDDIPELVDCATWAAEPYGRSVQVTVDGVTRYVVTSVVGRMQTLSGNDPWLCVTDRLPYPVELSATLDVLPGEQVLRGVRSAQGRIRSQLAHYHEHGMDPPHALDAARTRALDIQHEVEQGFSDLATRVDGWYRIAVAADTEDGAVARAAEVRGLYAPAVTVIAPPGQYALARELIPGETLSSVAYRRRLPVVTAAAAMPAVTATVGHTDGLYLGVTSGAGGHHTVLWHTHRSQEERERSGLTLIAGVPGAGKSSLLFQVVYQSTLAGVRWVVLDPGGATARLCGLAELAPYSRHTDLMNAVPGTLNPYRVVTAPPREAFDTEAGFAHAVAMVESQRRQLCGDILHMFLPPAIAEMADSQIALRQAVRRTPAGRDASPRQVLDELKGAGGHAAVVAEFLEDVAELPTAQLVFPTGGELDYTAGDDHIRLEVVTMRGLVLPRQGIDRREYTSEEAMAAPLLQLAAYRVAQVMYAGHGRKGIAIDECWQLARVGSGRSLLNDLARQSRKMNTRVILASQQVGDILTADVGPLVDSAFIGRLEDAQAQKDALEVLRVPTGVGFEAALGTLSAHTRGAAGRSGSRDMVFGDGEGGVEKVRIDLGHLPDHVRAALDTTPAVRALV